MIAIKEKSPHGVKPLPTTFRSGGFKFRQLAREGEVALFEKTKGRKDCSYEVVRVLRRNARIAFGKMLPACEVIPSSERWGKDGWTYRDLVRARNKFCERVEAQEQRVLGTPKPGNHRGLLE